MRKNRIKLLAFLLTCVFLLTVGACGGAQKDNQKPNNSIENPESSDPYLDDGYFQ